MQIGDRGTATGKGSLSTILQRAVVEGWVDEDGRPVRTVREVIAAREVRDVAGRVIKTNLARVDA